MLCLLRRNMYIFTKDDKAAMNFIGLFPGGIWISICVTFTATGIAMLLTLEYGRSGSSEPEDIQDSYHSDLHFMLPIHSLFMQGVADTPWKLSSRIVFVAAFLCSVVLFNSYSANMTSMFAVKRTVYPFRDYNSLLNDSPFNVILIGGTASATMFQASNINMHPLWTIGSIPFSATVWVTQSKENFL